MKRFCLVIIALLAAAACESSDLNQPCNLVRGLPDGGKTEILNSDSVIRNSANKDFISFGSVECEEYVCVRDSAYVDDAGTGDTPARGYCSRPCVANSSVGCPSFQGSLDNQPSTKLSCRPLILDEATLAAIKAKDPGAYQRYFGMTTSPYFCARSAVVPDAGN